MWELVQAAVVRLGVLGAGWEGLSELARECWRRAELTVCSLPALRGTTKVEGTLWGHQIQSSPRAHNPITAAEPQLWSRAGLPLLRGVMELAFCSSSESVSVEKTFKNRELLLTQMA